MTNVFSEIDYEIEKQHILKSLKRNRKDVHNVQ